jgi:hypothetical protein
MPQGVASFAHISRYVISVAVVPAPGSVASVVPGITVSLALFQLDINDKQQQAGNRHQGIERPMPNIR